MRLALVRVLGAVCVPFGVLPACCPWPRGLALVRAPRLSQVESEQCLLFPLRVNRVFGVVLGHEDRLPRVVRFTEPPQGVRALPVLVILGRGVGCSDGST